MKLLKTSIALSVLLSTISVASHANNIINFQKRNTEFSIDGDNGARNGIQAYLWNTSDTNVNQQWVELERENGFVSYQKRNTTLCLDGGNGGELRQAVILFPCDADNINQHWEQIPQVDGHVRLKKRGVSFSIDGNRGAARRQVIYLWRSGDSNVNQHWVRNVVATTDTSDVANVTNGNNAGAGSLRQALSENASTININSNVRTITIFETLDYDSEDSVEIVGLGSNQTIDASNIPEDNDILSINQGASFGITNLNFVGNIIEVNDDPNDPNNGTGIFVDVPNSRTGTVEVTLDDVSISNTGSHGVHVSDCSVRDFCVEGEGSPASVSLEANNVTIDSVGIGRQDGDGIRLDERGDGDVTFIAQNSTFINVGADGVELDEGDDGDIIANVDNSVFDSNGEFCNFADEVEGTPCDNDGAPDLDDGFDIDEIGSGSILVNITNSQFINNSDEGLDFDEENGGNIEITSSDSLYQNNEDQGIRASETGGGNVEISLTRVSVGDNNQDDEAIRVEEENSGDIVIEITDSTVLDNDTDDEGLRIEESDSGDGTLEIRNSNFTEFDLDNVDQI